MATSVYQIERFASSVFAVFYLNGSQCLRVADFDSRERAENYSREANDNAKRYDEGDYFEVRLVDRRGPTHEELDGTYGEVQPERRAERPDAGWIIGQCPCCGSDLIVNAYYIGGKGYRMWRECWESLGSVKERTCCFREEVRRSAASRR